MAANEHTLEELIAEAQALLDEKPRKRKKSSYVQYEFHRDPVTGLRESKYKYRPRFKSESPAKNMNLQHLEAGSSSEVIGPSFDVHVSSFDQDDAWDQEQDHEEDQSLETVLEKCQAALDSFHSVEEIKWEKRMENLNENWEASRPSIFKAILHLEGSGMLSPVCEVCHREAWLVRCVECGGKRMCPECDATVHEQLVFHDREAFLEGTFRHIPPTMKMNEDGRLEQTRKHFLYHLVADLCPQCQRDTLTLCSSGGSIIVVTQKGRFDFSNYTVVCSCCGYKLNPMSLEKIISAGYWPGSPKDCTYFFHQDLFRQWDFLQKRLPGTSEVSFLKSLGDFSQSRGRAPTITAHSFSRSFKEWKFCMHEVQVSQGMSWMECPTCSLNQHSCHVDGNMKLYRFQSSGKQKRPCYYGSTFISSKYDVDQHIRDVYAKTTRSKNVRDSMCGESHWRAAQNTARKRGRLDETGLEIAGCRHGLAQWAVNMYQGEIYGYAHFIQSQKMLPAGVHFFWEDIVCKYWKWASKIGGSETTVMKPALSVMHAKAHKWSCQVIWGGRWQEGSACSTGEEVEQINAHMSRCGNTTKYMLPEGRDELLTEHAIAWNRRKICSMVVTLVKRFARAVKMSASSYKDCDTVLEECNLERKDLDVSVWKEEIIQHAKEEDLASNSRDAVSDTIKLKHQMEMLFFSIMHTATAINKQSDTSKQRTRLRKKMSSEKTKIESLLDKYNSLMSSSGEDLLTIEDVMAGNFPDDIDHSGVLPIRVKSRIVDAFEIHDRWMEEVQLLKTEMANFLKFYTDVRIPALQQSIVNLEEKMGSQVELRPVEEQIHVPSSSTDTEIHVNRAVQTVQYSCCETEDPCIVHGKIVFLRKGLFFCREQVKKAIASFHRVLHPDNANDLKDNEDADSIIDHGGDDDDSVIDDGGDDADSVSNHGGGSDDEGEVYESVSSFSESLNFAEGEIVAPMRPNIHNTVFIWDFPHSISQSTIQGRNGSSACSIIALLIAHEVHQLNCDLNRSPALPAVWVTIMCECIQVGNGLYEHSRASLPQRYLSAAEAAMVAGARLDVSIGQPLPVRVSDPHLPSTLSHHLLQLCEDQFLRYSLFIINEKTVLFIGIRNEKLVLVDSHQHGHNGVAVILGKPSNVGDFVQTVTESLGFDNDTFGNLVNISF